MTFMSEDDWKQCAENFFVVIASPIIMVFMCLCILISPLMVLYYAMVRWLKNQKNKDIEIFYDESQ